MRALVGVAVGVLAFVPVGEARKVEPAPDPDLLEVSGEFSVFMPGGDSLEIDVTGVVSHTRYDGILVTPASGKPMEFGLRLPNGLAPPFVDGDTIHAVVVMTNVETSSYHAVITDGAGNLLLATGDSVRDAAAPGWTFARGPRFKKERTRHGKGHVVTRSYGVTLTVGERSVTVAEPRTWQRFDAGDDAQFAVSGVVVEIDYVGMKRPLHWTNGYRRYAIVRMQKPR
jgi:hypothetical protein